MLPPVSAVGSSSAQADHAFVARRRDVPTVADKTRLAGVALERSKRELATAQLQAARQDQQIADARRELERLRWLDARAEADAEAGSVAAAAAATQTAAIEAAVRAGADTSARILRLQGRIERQTTRFFDLQIRARETEPREKGEARMESVESEREKVSLAPETPEPEIPQEPSVRTADKRQSSRREKGAMDIRDFAALARRVASRRAEKPEAAENI